MDCLIGLDIGTSSVKGVLMSCDGDILSHSNIKLKYYTEDGLKVMHADEFCEACFAAIKELTLSDNNRVVALCPSGASGNVLFVKDGKSSSSVYGWQNEYDEKIICKCIGKLDEQEVYNTVGWPKLNTFPLAALSYVKECKPELIEKSDMICMHIEYLNYVLTGKWGITLSMGTPFYLMNQAEGQYHKEYLDLLGINENQLPPIMDNCSIIGELTEFAAYKTGLIEGTAVVLGTFDHPSAARGAGVFDENEIMLSCGTSWVVFIPFSNRNKAFAAGNMLVDRFMYPHGNWCGMLSLSSIADKIDKYKKMYIGDITYEQFDMLSEASVPGANGLKLDESDICTKTRNNSDVARAIMESVARELDVVLKGIDTNADTIKIVGGITNSKVWLDVISYITGKKISVVNGECSGAVGSAIMAGVGIGIYKNEMDFFENRRQVI